MVILPVNVLLKQLNMLDLNSSTRGVWITAKFMLGQHKQIPTYFQTKYQTRAGGIVYIYIHMYIYIYIYTLCCSTLTVDIYYIIQWYIIRFFPMLTMAAVMPLLNHGLSCHGQSPSLFCIPVIERISISVQISWAVFQHLKSGVPATNWLVATGFPSSWIVIIPNILLQYTLWLWLT